MSRVFVLIYLYLYNTRLWYIVGNRRKERSKRDRVRGLEGRSGCEHASPNQVRKRPKTWYGGQGGPGLV